MNPLMIIHCAVGWEPRARVEWCLQNWRRHHRDMPGLLISDGAAPWHQEVASAFDVEHHDGLACKRIEFGSLWLARMLALGVAAAERRECDVLWKIDPDTLVQRSFQDDPPAADWFGYIHNSRAPHVQGGCAFLRVSAAQKMLEGAIHCSRFSTYESWMPETLNPGVKEWARATRWVSGDFITLALVRELGLSMKNWSEIYSVCGATAPRNDLEGYAVIHPVLRN